MKIKCNVSWAKHSKLVIPPLSTSLPFASWRFQGWISWLCGMLNKHSSLQLDVCGIFQVIQEVRSSNGVLNPDFPTLSPVTEATSCLCRIRWTILASKKQTRTTLCVPSVTLPFQWSEGSWWLLSDGNNFLNLKWSVNKFGVSSSPPPSSFVQFFQRKNYCARLAWGKPGCPQKQPRGRGGGQEDVPCSWGGSEGDQDSHCCSCFYS